MRPHPVGRNRHPAEAPLFGLLDRFRALNPNLAQAQNDLWVVDDIPDRSDWSIGHSGGGNNIDCSPHTPAIAKFFGNDDTFLI